MSSSLFRVESVGLRVFAALALAASPALAQDTRAAIALAEARLACAADEPERRIEHLEVARAALEEAVARSPSEGRPRAILARVRLGLNRSEAALAAAESAARLLPDAPGPRLSQGEALLRLADPVAALEALHQAAERDPGRAEGALLLRQRARARLRTGDLDGAAEDARRALEREPSSVDAEALVRWCARRAAAAGARGVTGAGATATAGPAEDKEGAPGTAFLVRSEVGEEALAQAAARLERLEGEAAAVLGPIAAPTRRTPVHLVSLERYAKLAPEGGSGARAFYQRDEAAVYVVWEKPREAVRLLAHEAVHALLHRVVEDAPAWLDEGLADALAEDPHPVRLRDALVLLGAGKDVRFSEIALRSRREMYASDGIHLRFAGAWGAVRYLRAEEPARLERILDAVRAGGSPAEVVARGFGDLESLSEFDRRWKAHVVALPLRE